jgi:hypothetical protein
MVRSRVAVAHWLVASWMETAHVGFHLGDRHPHHHSRQQALGVFLRPFTCLCHCSQTSLTSHLFSFLTCTRVCSGWDVRSTAKGWVQDGVAGCRPHQVSPERPPRIMAWRGVAWRGMVWRGVRTCVLVQCAWPTCVAIVRAPFAIARDL